jgi:hypothetical protein
MKALILAAAVIVESKGVVLE